MDSIFYALYVMTFLFIVIGIFALVNVSPNKEDGDE